MFNKASNTTITFISLISTIGLLGAIGWKVTVISSNFISLIIILTISMNVHIIVRYLLINTSNTNTNCSQASKTVVINKNIDSPGLTLDSGSPGQVAGSLLNLNQVSQSVCINTPIVPIIYSFSGVSNGVNVSGLPFGISAVVSNGVVTISGTHDQIGVYNFIVTTTVSNQCNELSAQGAIEYKLCD